MVNFTNILSTTYSYESFANSFFCTYILGLYFFVKEYWRKICCKMLVKLTLVEEVKKCSTRWIFSINIFLREWWCKSISQYNLVQCYKKHQSGYKFESLLVFFGLLAPMINCLATTEVMSMSWNEIIFIVPKLWREKKMLISECWRQVDNSTKHVMR